MEKKFDLLEANLVSTWKYQGNDFCSVCRNDLSEVSLDATAHMDDTTHDGHQVAIGAPPPSVGSAAERCSRVRLRHHANTFLLT